jgi:hypothetical protein
MTAEHFGSEFKIPRTWPFGGLTPHGLGEIFVSNHRADSHADAFARDSAILASICLQFGCALDVLRKALLRDPHGNASTPIGVALDLLGSGHDRLRR